MRRCIQGNGVYMMIIISCIFLGCRTSRERFRATALEIHGEWQVTEIRSDRNTQFDHYLLDYRISFDEEGVLYIDDPAGKPYSQGSWHLYQDEDQGEDCTTEYHIGLLINGDPTNTQLLMGQLNTRRKRMCIRINQEGVNHRVFLIPTFRRI
ncbi:MAG: hypothetical protein KTR24_04210 [Saprospiraceae bacterium]|nr:hypothetical protein [Saprospiraceae bacterium]